MCTLAKDGSRAPVGTVEPQMTQMVADDADAIASDFAAEWGGHGSGMAHTRPSSPTSTSATAHRLGSEHPTAGCAIAPGVSIKHVMFGERAAILGTEARAFWVAQRGDAIASLLPCREIVGREFHIDTGQLSLKLRIEPRSTTQPRVAHIADGAIQFGDRLFHQGILRGGQMIDLHKAPDCGDSVGRKVVRTFHAHAGSVRKANRRVKRHVPTACSSGIHYPRVVRTRSAVRRPTRRSVSE